MLKPAEALARILRDATALPATDVPLDDALGRVLASPIDAAYDSPSFSNSAMDGYAVHASDVASATDDTPVRLPVVGESKAGDAIPEPLSLGQVMRIFTGAPMPPDADAVVVQEDTSRDGDDVVIRYASNVGRHVRLRGSDFQRGARLLDAGHIIDPGTIALLASQSFASVSVHRQPRVTILSTGDELQPVGSELQPGQIVNSNGPMLRALVHRAGATATTGHVPDSLDAATHAMREAITNADIVLTTGGVSVGDHDVVKAAMDAAGVETHFWKIAVKPGKPVVYGTAGNTAVIGLPGNPASSFVTFLLFVQPLIRCLLGDAAPFPQTIHGVLRRAVRHRPGRVEFLRARVEGNEFVLHAKQGSGALAALASCDALVEIPEHAEGVDVGTELRGIRVGTRGSSKPPFLSGEG